ncbi:MAG: DUF6133 family protein [Anaerocolumna sp.]
MRKLREITQEKLVGAKIRLQRVGDAVVEKLKDDSGNFLEEALKYIIGIVVGALFLGGVYLLFKNIILPTLGTKVQDLFNFTA